MTPLTPEQRAARGARVKEILADPAFLDAIRMTEQALFAEWQAAETPEKREEAHGTSRGLQKLLDTLLWVQYDGQIAEEATRKAREAQ